MKIVIRNDATVKLSDVAKLMQWYNLQLKASYWGGRCTLDGKLSSIDIVADLEISSPPYPLSPVAPWGIGHVEVNHETGEEIYDFSQETWDKIVRALNDPDASASME